MTSANLPHLIIATFLPLGGLAASASAAQDGPHGPERPHLEARPLEGGARVRLDGRLDEPAWRMAAPIDGFRQREPSEGEPATERTEVRVLYDGESLYIGVWAFDSEPDAIIARQLERDASLGLSRFGSSGGDDAIEIIFDTFHDRRNAYYFATNPRGVQVDGLIADESESPDLNWDAVWDVRARVTADGWTAEFVIPFRTLRFPSNRAEQTWGFNVQRTLVRKNEQSLWTAWSRDNEGLSRVSRAGELTGLGSLRQGLNVAVKPYTLAEAGRDYEGDPGGRTDLTGDIGLDAKLGFASGLVLDLTLNTDFAQVEADDEQIDLTRFNLFFPEKREFFLENAGIFEFGATQGFGPPPILLFFSRKIGLHETSFGEAQQVPIVGGARLTGRSGRQTIGLLSVVTGEDDALGAPVTNFAVGRIKRDIGERSYVGAIVTHRVEEGGPGNVAAGADWNFWLSGPLALRGFYARVGGSAARDGDAWRVALDYTADWIGGVAEHMEIAPDLDPGIGFIRRDNIARSFAALRLSPRPPVSGLRKVDIFNSFEYVASDESGRLRDWRWSLRVTPQLDAGDRASVRLSRRFQRLDQPFELTPGVTVPVGDYEDWSFNASLNTSRNRPVAAGVESGVEGFWDGTRRRFGGTLAFLSPHAGLELGATHNDIDVPAGAFTADLLRARINLALSTRLFGNALIQYNSQTGLFFANLRLDFIHRPDSDLFVVFNERRDVEDGRFIPVSRAFIVKLTYLRWF